VPNVVNVLKQDHRTVEKLFADFKESKDRSVVDQICDELDVHTRAEEQIVYPVLRSDVPDGEGLADHAEEEHAEARQLIGRIRQTTDEEHLEELVTELEGAIQEHVSDEEGEVFPKMESAIDASRLEQMGAEVESQKADA